MDCKNCASDIKTMFVRADLSEHLTMPVVYLQYFRMSKRGSSVVTCYLFFIFHALHHPWFAAKQPPLSLNIGGLFLLQVPLISPLAPPHSDALWCKCMMWLWYIDIVNSLKYIFDDKAKYWFWLVTKYKNQCIECSRLQPFHMFGHKLDS